MRVAALYDVHGNLPALEAVLAELEQVRADLILFGGDIVAGAFPAETLALVRSLGERARSVRGNADYALPNATEMVRGISDWASSRLNDEERTYLERLPQREVIEIEGLGHALFCHATPRNDTDIFTARTPDKRVRELLGEIDQRLVVCGHTHMQFDRVVDGIRIVNAGSVGMPYADRPGAYWALIGPDEVELRRTEYDLEAAADRIRASGWPDAEEFAAENVLTVPTAEEASAYFESLAR